MADASQGPGSGPPSVPTPRPFPKRARLRFPSPGEFPVRGTPALPPEIEFLVQHGISADRLLHALASKPAGVEPLDALLAEGIVGEEQYYHALAQHLGCMYYVGEPPFAEHFDAVRSLKCGVAALAERCSGPRAVIAPRGQLVPRLIETRTAGHLHPGSFAVASPHRFAALVRMRRGDDLLADALARIPDSMSARRGMSGAQIATAGLATIAAFVLGVENFQRADRQRVRGALAAVLGLNRPALGGRNRPPG